ncbi:MAG: PaaI family thioesterase [Acidobacteria bacterium]|nr:PaaI family thioesterase [Acidobacteriota bacterium]
MTQQDARELLLNLETKNCYVCGPQNAAGLRISFVADGQHGARAEYIARAEHCGWPGLLHGGITFALMDEALAYALYMQGLFGVTAKVQTRFRQPIRVGEKLLIRAWTQEQRRRLVDARAEIRLDSAGNPLVAEADATMYLQEPAKEQRPVTGS